MGTIRTKDGTEIFYKDWGKGQPLFFHHGWPLSADDWDSQMMFFLARDYRVIAHDRRGHGRSTQTADGHDMDNHLTGEPTNNGAKRSIGRDRYFYRTRSVTSRLIMSETFWPPNPNEFDIPVATRASLALCGTTSNGIAGSGMS